MSIASEVAAPLMAASERRRLSSGAEFLLVGGATLFVMPALTILRLALGLDDAELAVGFLFFHAAYVINDPHFAVTYLLFYRDARARAFGDALSGVQRLRYWLAGAVAPIGLIAWAAVALSRRSAASLGWMIQLMFWLVGWHYTKQGFGVLAVLSARRGGRFSSLERGVFLAHSFAGWAYAWASPSDPGRLLEEKGIVFRSLAHGPAVELVTLCIFLLSALGVIATLVARLLSGQRLPPLGPLLGYLITIWIWTIFTSVEPLLVYVIPALHSVQYLYFVWLIRYNEAKASEGPPLFGKPASVRVGALAVAALGLGLVLFHLAPSVIDDVVVTRAWRASDPTGYMGVTPFFAAIYTVVNIHHFFMDTVIWRRENAETRFLRA